MKCPKCVTELAASEIDGLELDLCPDCGGVWFEADELRQAKDLADENLNWMDFDLWRHQEEFQIRPGLACPRCSVPMGSIEYASTGVVVESCPGCRGAWLDADDLERIVRALEEELADKPSGELFADTLREALEVITHPESLASEWRDLRQVLRLLHLRLTVEKPGLSEHIRAILGSTPFS